MPISTIDILSALGRHKYTISNGRRLITAFRVHISVRSHSFNLSDFRNGMRSQVEETNSSFPNTARLELRVAEEGTEFIHYPAGRCYYMPFLSIERLRMCQSVVFRTRLRAQMTIDFPLRILKAETCAIF